MENLSQQNRLLTIETPLGKNALVLTDLKGHERLSASFEFTLTVLSPLEHRQLATLYQQPIKFTVKPKGQTTRDFHGIVRAVKLQAGGVRDWHRYVLVIIPHRWQLLTKTHRRIFRHQSVVDIFKALAAEHNFNQFDFSNIIYDYPQQDYIVQYDETDYDFACRLLEEAGIFYYYTMQSKRAPELILFDDGLNLPICSEVLTTAPINSTVTTGLDAIVERTYNTTAMQSIEMLRSNNAVTVKNPFRVERIFYGLQTKDKTSADALARRKVMIANWKNHQHTLNTNKIALHPGQCFTLDKKYYSYCIEHAAHDHSYLQDRDPAHQDQQSANYQNKITVIAAEFPFMPALTHKRPELPGQLRAHVLGEELHGTSHDQQGRLHVQFNFDESHTSCWIRLRQAQSDDHFGCQHIPRTGQEVLISHDQGNLDRPLITAAAYNSDNRTPQTLPKYQAITGTRGRSNASQKKHQANEYYTNDQVGHEKLYLQAQKDMIRTAKANETIRTEHDHHSVVQGGDADHTIGRQSTMDGASLVHFTAGKGLLRLTPAGIDVLGTVVSINPGGPLEQVVPVMNKKIKPATYVDVIYNTGDNCYPITWKIHLRQSQT